MSHDGFNLVLGEMVSSHDYLIFYNIARITLFLSATSKIWLIP